MQASNSGELQQKAITTIVKDYVKKYHPHTRREIARYLKRRREFPYLMVRHVVNELFEQGELPGVLI